VKENVYKVQDENITLDDAYEELKICIDEKYDFKKAMELCKEIIKIDSEFKGVNFYLAYCSDRLGYIKSAEYYYKKHLLKDPKSVITINNLAGILCRLCKQEEAIELFKAILDDISISQSDFYSNYLLYLNYNIKLNSKEIFQEHLKFSEFLNERKITEGFYNELAPNKKIKVGYISNDFKLHSVAYFILAQIALHNKDNFQVFCYSDVRNPDFITEQIKSYSDNFVNISEMNNEEVSNLIKRDEIDILFDLGGHLGINRLPVFAMKPAPIQINAIGYPNTTGLKNMDYRLTDDYCDPYGESDEIHTEKLIRMSNSFLCYTNSAEAPEINKKNNDTIVFGSYNNSCKLNGNTIKVWSEILKRVPESILVIKSNIFFDDVALQEFKDKFKVYGINEDRLKFITMHITIKEHLDSYNEMDIALDTFPYNGTTTTCEALFMGVPVITLVGDRHASRVGDSILSNLNLKELIAHDEKEYIEKAVNLAKNKEHIKFLNKNLREFMINSPIMDSGAYVEEFEDILGKLWIKWCNEQQEHNEIESSNREDLPKFSLCMIVKDEEKYIEKCLSNIKDKIDEIIVVDTGSKDRTKELAKKYTDKIFDFEWCEDFSKARNYSISKAKNDWILVLDADEICSEFHVNKINDFIKASIDTIGRINIINYYGKASETKKSSTRLGRLFNKNFYEYNGSIHEQLTSKNKSEVKMLNVDIGVEHFGYTEEDIMEKMKVTRNENLLLKELEKKSKDPYILYQLGKTYFIAKRYYKALNYFRESIEVLEDTNFEYAEDLIESYGYSLLNTKKYKEALGLEKYINKYNGLADFNFLMGLIYMNNGIFEKAIKFFEKCLICVSGKIAGINKVLPLYNLGVIYECIGSTNKAIEYYKQCENYELAKERLGKML
jgi:Predicted O-linked N-acetylglucosamine transferase, SPINDLY family